MKLIKPIIYHDFPCWWYTYPSEKYERQLGLLYYSQLNGKNEIHVPNSTNQFRSIFHHIPSQLGIAPNHQQVYMFSSNNITHSIFHKGSASDFHPRKRSAQLGVSIPSWGYPNGWFTRGSPVLGNLH
jgi:hypothetical protein